MNKKIVVKFNWIRSSWKNNFKIFPIINSDFIGNYTEYVNNNRKYFSDLILPQKNYIYKNYLNTLVLDNCGNGYIAGLKNIKRSIRIVKDIKRL